MSIAIPLTRPLTSPLTRAITEAGVMNGWFFPLIDESTGILSPSVTFTRASTGTYFDVAGLIQSAAIDAARYDYDPVSHVLRGLLIEEQRTNILLRSQEFDGAVWTKTNCTVTTNARTDPLGTSTADRIVVTATAATSITQSVTATATSHSYSTYVHEDSNRTSLTFLVRNQTTATNFQVATFTPQTGAISGAGWVSTAIGGGWYRLTFSQTTGITAGNTIVIYSGAGGSTHTAGDYWYVWGGQFEAGGFVTTYAPTAGASATRSPDVATATDLTAIRFNAAQGTLYVEGRAPPSVAAAATLASFNDGTANEVIRLHMNAAGALRAQVIDGGVTVADLALGTITASQSFTAALTYTADSIKGCLDGGTVQTDSAATIPTVDRLMIGRGAGGDYWGGHIARLRYYPTIQDTQAATA